MIPASQLGKAKDETDDLKLTNQEQEMLGVLASIWKSILSLDVDDSTDFFASGAGSMDVVR